MAKTIGSFDLASLKNLRDDVTQYFWFESNSSSAWGSGAHVTLYPESQFTDSTNPNYMKGQNIIMNTDGFSIRNGGLPMMVLDNNSLDFNAVDTSLGTYVTMATFGLNGVQIGADSTAYALINADEFSARNADGVKFFDANFNGGSISVPTFIDSTIYKTISVSGTRYTIPFTINIPNNIPVGTTLTSEKPVLGNNYPPSCALTYKSGTQITTFISETGKLKGSYSSLLKRNSIWYTEQISFTIGTSKTIIAESDGAVSFQYGNSTISVVYTLNYDASVNKLFGEIIIISSIGANTGLDVMITNRYKYNAVTTAPSFTFGQRTAENSNGNFSTIIGNELIAKQDYQTVIGLFNNNKTNTLFEIGNGTANNMRSNALTVDLDGNVEAAGALFANGAEFSKKASNHIVIGGYHVCWGFETITHSGSGYLETEITLPYTYTSAPRCFASYGNRPLGGAARTPYAVQSSNQVGNKMYVGSYATGSVTAYVNWMTIGV